MNRYLIPCLSISNGIEQQCTCFVDNQDVAFIATLSYAILFQGQRQFITIKQQEKNIYSLRQKQHEIVVYTQYKKAFETGLRVLQQPKYIVSFNGIKCSLSYNFNQVLVENSSRQFSFNIQQAKLSLADNRLLSQKFYIYFESKQLANEFFSTVQVVLHQKQIQINLYSLQNSRIKEQSITQQNSNSAINDDYLQHDLQNLYIRGRQFKQKSSIQSLLLPSVEKAYNHQKTAQCEPIRQQGQLGPSDSEAEDKVQQTDALGQQIDVLPLDQQEQSLSEEAPVSVLQAKMTKIRSPAAHESVGECDTEKPADQQKPPEELQLSAPGKEQLDVGQLQSQAKLFFERGFECFTSRYKRVLLVFQFTVNGLRLLEHRGLMSRKYYVRNFALGAPQASGLVSFAFVDERARNHIYFGEEGLVGSISQCYGLMYYSQ